MEQAACLLNFHELLQAGGLCDDELQGASMSRSFLGGTAVAGGLVALSLAAVGLGQAPQPNEGESTSVVIRREPLRLTPPETYRLALQLEPIQQIDLVAPCDGTVESVDADAGKAVKSQELLVRMSATERQLMLDRSLALLKVAELEIEQAQRTKQNVELAEARLRAAQADAKLLQFQVEQLAGRAPFAGVILKTHVQAGQVVKSGERLVTLADVSRVKVELPVDRELVKAGENLKLRIENQTLDARVEKVLPAEAKFEKTRDLATSLATATIVLDNADAKWHVGQAVFAPLVPKHPVAGVATVAVSVGDNGQRKVQVVRQGMIRDVEVDLAGHVGTERVIVSGAFADGDEVILSSSRELADGTQIRANPSAALPARAVPATTAVTPPAATKPKDTAAAPEKKKSVSGF